MDIDIVVAEAADRDLDGFKRTLALIGIGYAALVCLAFYADYKIRIRRARKRREAREAKEEEGRE
ncbi:MAG: hypothetical protein AAB554_05445 [Patescibacteria group bacterium]